MDRGDRIASTIMTGEILSALVDHTYATHNFKNKKKKSQLTLLGLLYIGSLLLSWAGQPKELISSRTASTLRRR